MIFGLFSDRFGLFEVFKILNEPLNLHGVDDGGREDISVFLTFVYIDQGQWNDGWRQRQIPAIFDLQIKKFMTYQNAYKKRGICFQTIPPYSQMPNRSIITNVPDRDVTNNQIKTSKYNILDFIPLNLMVQFSKLPNIYFLIIGIMQMIPEISISGGFPVIFIPLSMVVAVSAAKDLFEDLKRKKTDREINHTPTRVLSSGGFQQVLWKDVRIGDIVRVQQNEEFPADMILLQSSQEKLNCFIETKNLDGQTNLKYKQVKFEMGKHLREFKDDRLRQLYDLRYEFQYERPNPFIYSFTGSHKGIPLDNNHIVLRGCRLKITKWVTGVVIYTGVDSKIMLNSNKPRQKKSRLQFKMGLIVIAIFIAQMIMTFFCAVVNIQSTLLNFMDRNKIISQTTNLFVNWGSWVLLFTNFVPISLIVTLEMVKYLQGINISNCHFRTNDPAEVRVQTSTLNEELGQIQHLFSDKTGTLTRNYMSFKHMVVGQKTYGYDQHKSPIPKEITNVDFHDQQFFRIVRQNSYEVGSDMFHMLIALSLCHNVIIEEDQQGNRRYNASSPDELAFINMAKYCGWQYIGTNENNEVCVRTSNGIIKYKILHIIEFDSDRKRMSVILQKDDKIIVYCKGADNIIMQRLKNKDTKTFKVVNERIGQWSKTGLRTLLFAKREIDKKDYEKWAKMYASSLSKLEKIEKSNRSKLKQRIQKKLSIRENEQARTNVKGWQGFAKMIIEDQSLPQQLLTQTPQIIVHRILNDNSLLTENQKLFIEKYFDQLSEECTSSSKEIEQILEKQFQLIGATAIEDQLQDNVKGTIQKIRRAGVKVWMLTGDKKQTAINIGISCGLVQTDMAVLEWQENIQDTLKMKQDYGLRQCCLVATGEDLLKPVEQKLLLQLVNGCSAIICCRVTPKQKQDMVWLMRKNKCTTMAIGDGANDVNMINTAHVGIGIKGVEGAQAALCSDYAISEFQIVGELMLYHGRESYRKNSQLILFNFYKNLILVLPQFWYGLYNNFSSATIYDPWVHQLYNVAFTSFPIMIYAIYDQQYSVTRSLAEPQLYDLGLNNRLFNVKAISLWFIAPAIQALILVNVSFFGQQFTIDKNGRILDLMGSGMTIFIVCVVLANLKILILSYKMSIGLFLSIIFGIVSFYICSAIAQRIFLYSDMRNVLSMQIRSQSYWFSILAIVGVIFCFESIFKRYQRLKHLEKRVRIEFVEQEIELSLLGRDMSLKEIIE